MLLILPMTYDREKAQSTLPGFMSSTKNTSYKMRVTKSGVAADTKDKFFRKKFPEVFFLRVFEIDYVDAPSIDIKGYVFITLGQKTNKRYSDISGAYNFNYAL